MEKSKGSEQDYLEHEFVESELNSYEGCRNFFKVVLVIVGVFVLFTLGLMILILIS
jgi:hypothetical protein